MNLDNLKEEEKKAIEMTRAAAGLETVVRKTEEVELIGETLEEKKDRLNETELERIKKVKLSPGVSFSIWLIDWKDTLKEVIVTFPKTSQAMKYNNLTMNPNNSKIEIGFAEILENFKNDGLLKNFDVDDFPLSEVSELAGFLMRVIQNPKFK
jgi:hypothetical protein